MLFLCFVIRRISVSRRTSRGASRGALGFVTKNFRDTTYFWIILVSLKDLLLIMSPAIFSDAVTSMTLGGLLYAAYSLLTMIALPYTDNSSNVIEVILSFMISLQMLLTTSLGYADAVDAGVGGRTDSKFAA